MRCTVRWIPHSSDGALCYEWSAKGCTRTGTSPMKAFCGQLPSDEGDAAASDVLHLPMIGLSWPCMRTGTSPHALSPSDESPIHRTVHSAMNGPLVDVSPFMRTGTSPMNACPCRWMGGFIGRCTAKGMKKVPHNNLYLKITIENEILKFFLWSKKIL